MGSIGAQRIGGGGTVTADRLDPVVLSRLAQGAYDYERYHMSNGQTAVSNVTIESVGPIDEDGMAEVTYSYDAYVRIPVGVDPETGRLEMEYDSETRRNTRRLLARRV